MQIDRYVTHERVASGYLGGEFLPLSISLLQGVAQHGSYDWIFVHVHGFPKSQGITLSRTAVVGRTTWFLSRKTTCRSHHGQELPQLFGFLSSHRQGKQGQLSKAKDVYPRLTKPLGLGTLGTKTSSSILYLLCLQGMRRFTYTSRGNRQHRAGGIS